MKVLQIVGRKKAGKTTFLTRLVPLLCQQGLRVATVKHTRNPYPLDRPGTDSERHRAAGAEATLVLTASAGALHFDPPRDPADAEQLIARLLGGFDLVLIEGWRERRGPRIEIVTIREDGAADLLEHPEPGNLLALVLGPHAPRAAGQGEASRGIGQGEASRANGQGEASRAGAWPLVPVFAWDDVGAVRDLVVRWVTHPDKV